MPTDPSPDAETPDTPDAAFDAAQAHLNAGDFEAAFEACRAIVEADAEHARAWHLWGFVTLQRGDVESALERLERSVELGNPNPSLYMHLGLARALAGQTPGAIAALEVAVEAEPRLLPAQFNLGLVYKQAGRLGDAERALQNALDLHPDHADAWAELAGVYMTRNGPGDTARASDALTRALDIDPDHVGALNQRGLLDMHLGRGEAARDHLARAAELAPDLPEVQTNLGNALLGVDGHGAIEAFAHVLDTRPDFPGARARLAMAHERVGSVEAARTHAQAALETHDDAARAWAAASRANRLEIDARPPDSERREDMYDAIRSDRMWFTAERVADWPRTVDADTAAPVFFVGFPRSGTTVMEQILKAHPALVAGGENGWLFATRNAAPTPYPAALADMGPADVARLRAVYWDQVAQTIGQDAADELSAPGAKRRLIDKMPLNILHLGLVRRVFPDAKVLVALRDPRDCVLSAVMQNFHRTVFMDQFLTLDGAARFYGAVMGLWRHLDATLGLDAMTYRYEDLVTTPEPELRRVLDFIGVGWDDQVLAHAAHAQGATIATPSMRDAGEELYTRAVTRWPAYENELAPAMGMLAPFIDTLGYGDAE